MSAALLSPILRVVTGTILGLAAFGLLAGIALLRDAGALWVAADILLLGSAGAALAVGLVWLREAHARSAAVRAWVTLGAALLMLAAMVVALD